MHFVCICGKFRDETRIIVCSTENLAKIVKNAKPIENSALQSTILNISIINKIPCLIKLKIILKNIFTIFCTFKLEYHQLSFLTTFVVKYLVSNLPPQPKNDGLCCCYICFNGTYSIVVFLILLKW